MLSLFFLLSIWLGQTQPATTPDRAYPLLLVYVAFAFAIAAATWRNWWLDARLALPAHLVDMAVFTLIVFWTDAYTNPFFLFFILPLLAAAIRWGWRETALTAVVLIAIHIVGGVLVAGTQAFELQRFIVRSGHLLILSAVLIWFGMHQQFTKLFIGVDDLDRGLGDDEDPSRQALRTAMKAARASSGALMLDSDADGHFAGLVLTGGETGSVDSALPMMAEEAPVALFDLPRNRALTRARGVHYRFAAASQLLDRAALVEIGAPEGLIVAVRTGTRRGWLVLFDVPDLSIDFLDLGAEIGRVVEAVIDRGALLSATEQGIAARTRLSLARDVHDSVVQFLAGATFRVEATIRGARSGRDIEPDLQELKRLLIEEQAEIRSFVTALRRDRELDLPEAVDELKALARRLGRQWAIECHVDATKEGPAIPIRLQLDVEQLVREAVANAVRHGRASRVDVDVAVEDDRLRLEVKDNGSGFLPGDDASAAEPWSLKGRVDRARGSLSLHSVPGCTNILITLPLTGAAA